VLPQDNDTGGFFLALIEKGPPTSTDGITDAPIPQTPYQAVVASDLVPLSALLRADAKTVLAKHCLPPVDSVRRGLTVEERRRLWCSGDQGADGSATLVMVAPQDMPEDERGDVGGWRGVVQAGLQIAEAVELPRTALPSARGDVRKIR